MMMLTAEDVVCSLRRIRTRNGQSQEYVVEGANWYIDALEMLIPAELFNELVTVSAPSASTRLTKVKPKKAKAKK
jgi:hypothetical protein